MVIVYDNFDLMKDEPDRICFNSFDQRTMTFPPDKPGFFIPLSMQEALKYTIFEDNRIVRSGKILGNTFTTSGKAALATLVGGAGNAINAIICTVGGTDYSKSVTNAVSTNVLTVTSGTFTTAGTYTVVAGAYSTTKYNTISTNIVVGSGQSVQYVIEYTFTGPSAIGSYICACRLGNTGSYNYPLGTLDITTTDSVHYTKTLTPSVSGNTLTVDNSSGFTVPSLKTIAIFTYYTSTVQNNFYNTTSMTIPLNTSQTLNVRGLFVFG